MIELINLTKWFGKVRALDHITLSTRKGEVFGFLGPNAAGKTTTINILGGLVLPTSGIVKIGGFDLVKNPLAAKAITSVITDRPFIYGKLTVREYLRFIGQIYNLDSKKYEKRIEELMEFFEITAWADHLIESISHGINQRLVFSAALLPKPKVLVVDEPLVGLDPKGAWLTKEVLRGMAREGSTIFLSTHSMEVAEQVCNRLGIIHQGKLIALGTREELEKAAGLERERLEQVFLKITEEK